MNLSNALINNVHIEITPHGVRITLLDDPDKSMFQRGSAQFTPDFKNTLLIIAPICANAKTPITMTGHTDAVKGNGNGLDNGEFIFSPCPYCKAAS